VPTSANANSAIGRIEIGRASDRNSGRNSIEGSSATTHSAPTIATPVVVQGNNIAISAVKTSMLKIRAA
jgi:hypothetical protein